MEKFIIFTIIYLILICCVALIAFELEKKKFKKEKNQDISLIHFLNNYTKVTLKIVCVGIIFGIIFGMMDNISLFFGIDSLGKILKKKFNMDDFQIAGISNAYSGLLGITFATFVTLIAKYIFPDVNQDNLPVWLNMIGYLIGSVIGIYIPKLFLYFYKS